mgnify:FL=1
MNNTASNDITGDGIKTKASSQAYREGHDRIFGRPKDVATIKSKYECIGSANSSAFKRPIGNWVRFNMNSRGTYELWCNHETRQYYNNYCD